MHQYITDTRFAVNSLCEALTSERGELARLLGAQKEALKREAAFDIVFLQRQMHPSANYWYGAKMKAQSERLDLDSQVVSLERQLLDKRFSLSVLAGALLHIGKQGISVVWGNPANCRNGRTVCGVSLKAVIWAGRNQSQHYEELKKVDEVTALTMLTMAQNGASQLLAKPKDRESRALEVVEALGWLSFEAYSDDMESLLA